MIKDYNGNVTYQGCVFNLWEHNSYNDSDFYADVIDPITGEIKSIEYDTTRYAGCGTAQANIDLTKENYYTYLQNSYEKQLNEFVKKYQDDLRKVDKDKKVIVVKGRKVPKGTEGVVFWVGTQNYDKYNRSGYEVTRIGIKDEFGKIFWTSASNVEVIIQNQLSLEEIKHKFNEKQKNEYLEMAKRFNW